MSEVEKKVEKKKKKSVVTAKKENKQEEAKQEQVEEQPKLTQAQKLLKSVNEKRAAMKALMKSASNTRISFDDEGNQSTVEVVKPVINQRPAVKKPEPKKRKAEEGEEDSVKTEKKPPKKPKKTKKPKKAKAENSEEIKNDSKQADALAYVRLFVLDRSSWKFNKMHQIWILNHLYELPEEDFDGVLKYLKDLQGSAREKTRKEAEEKIPKKVVNSLTAYDGDDFDAEKLMAQAQAATTKAAEEEEEEEDDEDESTTIKRARKIAKVLR